MTPLTYLALVLALGIIAQWLAWRLKIPSILLLLAFGFGLAALTNVTIDDYMEQDTLLAIVGIFVAIILFEGGLTLKFSELREAGRPVLRMCTLGVFLPSSPARCSSSSSSIGTGAWRPSSVPSSWSQVPP